MVITMMKENMADLVYFFVQTIVAYLCEENKTGDFLSVTVTSIFSYGVK